MNKRIVNKLTIYPDKPLDDPKEDKLGYANFAENLANNILTTDATQGLVLALYGNWGSGKTTIINFILHFLLNQNNSNKPIVVKFNPWWFTGEENLVRHFFSQLRVAFEKEKVEGAAVGKELSEVLDRYMDSINDLATKFNMPWYVKVGAKGLKAFFAPSKEEDVVSLREKIFKKLKKLDKKIVVVIDDIDRLTAEEIRQIFRLVKAVGDFPNVIYLLSFDKNIVTTSLKDLQNLPGDEYLEKIVQISFEIPMPERTQLNVLFVEKINSILSEDSETEEYNKKHWQDLFFDGLERYLTTPRKVTILCNTFSVTYPAVKGEVNDLDFLTIEAIRVFNPTVYDLIRQNPDKFTGLPIRSYYSNQDRERTNFKNFHDAWLNALPQHERAAIRHILPFLFPKLHETFGRAQNDYDETQWRLLNRVSHPDAFPTYFRLGVSSGAISSLDMNAIVSLIANKKAFEQRLLELSHQKFSNGATHVKQVLDRLRDYGFKKISTENIPNVIEAFFNIGDKLILESDKGTDMFDYDNSVLMGRAIWPLLKRNDKETNFLILKKAIREGKSLSTMTREIAILGQQHGKMDSSPEPISEQFTALEQLSKLEQMIVRKIRKAGKMNILLDLPQLTNILYRWKEWAGEKEVKQWVEKTIKNDKNLLKLLIKFVSITTTYSSSGTIKNPRLDPDWFKPFVKDSEKFAERIKKLSKKRLSEEQKKAVEQFLKEYQLRKEGKDPSNPLVAWKK